MTYSKMVSPNRKFNKKRTCLIIAILICVVLLSFLFWVLLEKPFAAKVVTPVIGQFQPQTGYYLTFEGSDSRIFVESASVSSGAYPGETRIALVDGSKIVVEKGEPCAAINITLRNDYSIQNPQTILQDSDPTGTWIVLTAKVFHQETLINTTDLLNVGYSARVGAYAYLTAGEKATLSIYLATTSCSEITGFEIVPIGIAGVAAP